MINNSTKFRIGNGYDIHRLVFGRQLIIGGVKLEHPNTFKVSKSLLFLILSMNHMLEINIINGNNFKSILGIIMLVKIIGFKILTSKFLKNSISSNKFNIIPKT